MCDDNIGDFNIPEWLFRNKRNWQDIIDDLKRKDVALSTRKGYASQNGGVIDALIFDFDLEHIIPCMLHCVMAIVKKLLRLTVREAGKQGTPTYKS